MKAIRVGFIGAGYIASRAHLPALAPLVEQGKVVLQAFCDIDENTLKERAAEYGVDAIYTDYREMLDREELDALYICLPPTLHGDQVKVAADKGIHLFVEKPVSLDMTQAVEFSEVIERAGIVSQVGFNFRYYPSSEAARQLLLDRTVRHVAIQMFYSGNPIRWWTSRYEECGGSFVENTIHIVDLARYLVGSSAGDIVEVTAFYQWRQAGDGPEPMNLPHVYTVNYRFESGVLCNASTARVLYEAVNIGRRGITVVSDDSILEWSTEKLVENGETVFEDVEGISCQEHQARAFIAAVQAEDPAAVRSPYGHSINTLAAVLGANASAERGGEKLCLDDIVLGRTTWNPRVVLGQGVPPLE